MRIFFFLSLVLAIPFKSCTQEKEKKAPVEKKEMQQPLIEANKSRIRKESQEINAFIKRQGWDMKETGTGLRYMIYQKGSGIQATNGKIAMIRYNVTLLDGTQCYSSEETGPQEFRIGRDNVETGLHEGILLMKVGDKAKFILPPHLAHGLIGDMKKIPAMSTLIYDVELIGLR